MEELQVGYVFNVLYPYVVKCEQTDWSHSHI